MRISGKYFRKTIQPFMADTRVWQNLCIHACFCFALLFTQQHIVYAAGFMTTGNMTSERRNHTSTALADGRVLMTGGTTTSSTVFLSSAEIYDPATGSFTPTGSMTTGRAYHTATRLPDGRVLITGGSNSAGKLATAEIFDPTTGTNGSFTLTGSMNTARGVHTATLLNDGTVLVAGGQSGADKSSTLATAQIYRPETGTFSPTNGNLSVERRLHTATLLNDGRVLFTGGLTSSTATSTAEIYTPTAGTFTLAAAAMSAPRNKHTAVLLDDARVLIAGGYNGSMILDSAEIFDPSEAGTFRTTASMTSARGDHTATRLLNGKVLITGGYVTFGGSISATADVFNPASGGSFNAAGTMYSARAFHNAAILNNGTVVISGGTGTYLAPYSAELFDPIAIKMSPMIHTFPDTYVSEQSTALSLTITNSGSEVLTLNTIELSGKDGAMFTLDPGSCGPLPHTLAAHGGNCSINVTFIPTACGAGSASLDIHSTDPEKPILSAALNGTGSCLTLSIMFNGNGMGSTTSSQEGLSCLSSEAKACQATVAPGTEITVFAKGDENSLFAGWPDDCIFNGINGCTILVTGDSYVLASFNHIEPARVNSTYYPSLQDAYAGALTSGGKVIETRAVSFSGPVIFDADIGVTLKGGYDLNYSSNQDYTVVNSGLIIRSGLVVAEKIVIR